MKYFQSFRIVGVPNAIVYDDGLKSTEAEPKRLIAVHAQMNQYANVAAGDFATKEADVQGWHERAKVFDMPAKMIPVMISTGTTSTMPEPRSKPIAVDIDIPVGEIFKVAIKCSDTALKIRGVYEYEIMA